MVKKEETPVVLPGVPVAHKTEGMFCQLDFHPKPLFCC